MVDYLQGVRGSVDYLAGAHRRKALEYVFLLGLDEIDSSQKREEETEAKKQMMFWDVVVLTAIDERQKGFYEFMIKEKQNRREIPRLARFVELFDYQVFFLR